MSQEQVIKDFNKSPKRNLQKLCKVFGIDETNNDDVAQMLRTAAGLDGQAIGELVSDIEFTPAAVAYFAGMDLEGDILTALRKALSGRIEVPKEGEQIDRIIQFFAQAYSLQNVRYSSTDVIYIISYALIMLNTDLHNENMKKKMKKNEFIARIREFPDLEPGEVSDAELGAMYDDLKAQPLVFGGAAEDFFSPNAPKLKGRLRKKSGRPGSVWTEHFFVLAYMCLFYYDTDDVSGRLLGTISLEGCDVFGDSDQRVIVVKAKEDVIQYIKFGADNVPMPVLDTRTIYLMAPSTEVREKWLYKMHQATVAFGFMRHQMHVAGDEPVEQTSPFASSDAVTPRSGVSDHDEEAVS